MSENEKKSGFSWFGLGRRKAEDPVDETPPPAPEEDAPETVEALDAGVNLPPEAMEEHADEPLDAPEIAPEFAPEIPHDDEPAVSAAPEQEDKPVRKGFFARLKAGLKRSTTALSDGITGIFTKAKLDQETLDDLEDLLITTDLGVGVARAVTAELARDRFDKEISPEEVRAELARLIAQRLAPYAVPLELDPARKPHVVLVVGVNGTGKTTTIGKLAHRFRAEGRAVMLAAGDTFRAAAVEQLSIWAERTGSPIVKRDIGADAAGLAFDALKTATDDQCDVLLIDTAGRLQNKQGLMEELAKITRVLKKQDPEAPHSVILVLDATTGQNALSQVEVFKDVAGVTGLVMTKLDGTARGGILVALADKYALPIHAIGVGEGIEDFQAFEADGFARALTGADADG